MRQLISLLVNPYGWIGLLVLVGLFALWAVYYTKVIQPREQAEQSKARSARVRGA